MVERELSLSFLRVVEEAAIACAHTMGMGDRHHSDRVAVESMRKTMDEVRMRGTIVIGEGEVEDLVIIVLDRPRHEKLIGEIRAAGARIRLIGDGDLSAGISAAVAGTGVHAVMGSGGAPEGVLTAAAMRCLNGEILGRLVVKDDKQKERMQAMGIRDVNKIYTTQELAPGKNIVFAASGVTDGNLLKGVRFFGDGIRTQSIVMTLMPARVRFIDTVHLENKPDVKVRFR